MRPLQTCRKYHIVTEYCNNKIHHPVGAVIDRPGNFASAAHFPVGWGHPARGFEVTPTYRVNRTKGFPLWGKLSPQVTDEGATAGHSPLIRRASAPPSPPQGEGFFVVRLFFFAPFGL